MGNIITEPTGGAGEAVGANITTQPGTMQKEGRKKAYRLEA